jgi:hypothetical protein
MDEYAGRTPEGIVARRRLDPRASPRPARPSLTLGRPSPCRVTTHDHAIDRFAPTSPQRRRSRSDAHARGWTESARKELLLGNSRGKPTSQDRARRHRHACALSVCC